MTQRGRLRLAATLPATSQALATVVSRLAPGTPADDLGAIELGLAEVLTNLARHAFGPGDAGRINLHWATGDDGVDLQVTDCGRPIPSDTLAAAGRHPLDFEHTELAELPESGLGLVLVMRVFDSVGYRSRGGVNRLSLRRLWH